MVSNDVAFSVESLSIGVARAALGKAHPESSSAEQNDKWLELVTDVSFHVDRGEVLALVGESGSGKSLMLMGSIGLLPPGLTTLRGDTTFLGKPLKLSHKRSDSLAELKDPEWRSLVGMGIGVLFQDPIGSWNPLELIGEQSGEVLRTHEDLSEDEIKSRVLDLLGDVHLAKRRKFSSMPHEMSRGEAQRAMLAAALLSEPTLLIADEPLTGLDVTVARGVLDVIDRLRAERGMAMILVTHDLAVVAGVADRVGVVYGGEIIEMATTTDLYKNPKHPYTDGLLGSLPGFGKRLRPIEGDAPELDETWVGCSFAPRCGFAIDRCRVEAPAARQVEGSMVRCHRAEELDLVGIGR